MGRHATSSRVGEKGTTGGSKRETVKVEDKHKSLEKDQDGGKEKGKDESKEKTKDKEVCFVLYFSSGRGLMIFKHQLTPQQRENQLREQLLREKIKRSRQNSASNGSGNARVRV